MGNRAPEHANEVFKDLTGKTGGEFVSFTTQPSDARWAGTGAFDTLKIPQYERDGLMLASGGFAQAIDQFYRVQLRLAAPLDKPRDLKLEILDASRKREKSVQSIYPKQLVPCGQP